MRLVYIADSVLPSRTANSIHVMRICEAFSQNGHDITLIVPKPGGGTERADDLHAFYGAKSRFPIDCVPLPEMKGRQYLFALKAARRARQIAPELVLSRFVPASYLACLNGLNVVNEYHGLPEQRGRLFEWFYRRLIAHSNLRREIFISDYLKTYSIRKYGAAAHSMEVIHDAADEPDAAPPALRFNDGLLHVGYTGHLYAGRGIEIILEMAGRCPWARFHLVGGNEKDIGYWKDQAAGRANVQFHGFVPPARIQHYQRSFDALIAPYQSKVAIAGDAGDTSRWMSPLKIFEYMAAGKPALTSDMPALREILTDGETALLCHPERIEEWVAALTRLRDDPALRGAIGGKAFDAFMANHTWKIRARRLIGGLHEHPLSHS